VITRHVAARLLTPHIAYGALDLGTHAAFTANQPRLAILAEARWVPLPRLHTRRRLRVRIRRGWDMTKLVLELAWLSPDVQVDGR
jgi:hypothetical protein